jgi:hypothetical protein
VRITLDIATDADADLLARLLNRPIAAPSPLRPEDPPPVLTPLSHIVPPMIPDPPAPDPIAAAERKAALVTVGREAFARLVSDWLRNFGVEGADQPDRAGRLMATFSGYGREVSAYIREKGGLSGAVIDSILGLALCPADNAVALGKKVAGNMIQVGTATAIPLDQLLEKSMFKVGPWQTDDTPPTGGIAKDDPNWSFIRPVFEAPR